MLTSRVGGQAKFGIEGKDGTWDHANVRHHPHPRRVRSGSRLCGPADGPSSAAAFCAILETEGLEIGDADVVLPTLERGRTKMTGSVPCLREMPFRFYCRGRCRCLIFFAVLALCAAPTGPAQAQTQQDLLWQVYFQSMAYPEKFDTFVKENPSLSAQPFRRCIDEATQNLIGPANAHDEQCPKWPEKDRFECSDANKFTKMIVWLQGVKLVVSKKARWNQTTSGQNAFIGKEYIFGDQQVDLIRGLVPAIKEYINCSQ